MGDSAFNRDSDYSYADNLVAKQTPAIKYLVARPMAQSLSDIKGYDWIIVTPIRTNLYRILLAQKKDGGGIERFPQKGKPFLTNGRIDFAYFNQNKNIAKAILALHGYASTYYNADGTTRPNLTLKSEVQKGDIPQAGIGKGSEINNAKSDSIVDTVKNKTSEYATLVKTDKAYTGLALGIISGLGVAFYVNKKKHYGIAGYVGIALAGGAVGYFAGKAVKGGGLASVAGASGSKDSQIESKINSLIDKADANADKLDLKNNKTGKKVTPAEIAEGKEKIKKVLPVLLAKMTDREKDMALDFLALASTFLDKAIAEISKGAKFNPMMMLGFIAQATDELGKKYSEKELKDFMEKTQSLAS